MALKTRKALWAFAEEAVQGTPEILTSDDVLKVVSEGINLDGLEPMLFPDNTVHSELGEHPDFAPNIAKWVLPTVSVAAAGHNLSSGNELTKLSYGHLLEACGFEALDGDSGTNEVLKLTIGAITGATVLRHGETVTSTSGKEGVVIGDTWNGTTTLYIEDTGGTTWTTSSVLTGADSGASATISAIQTRRPHAYRMLSDPDDGVTLTGGLFYDGKLIRAKGCRGNMTLRIDHGNRAFFDFNFTGIAHNLGSTSGFHVIDTAFPTGMEYPDATAQPALGLNLTLNNGSLSTTPVFNRLQLDCGNGVVLQEDTNDTAGWDVARITTRQPRLRLNPREVAESSYTYWDDYARGITARTRFNLGNTSGATRFTIMCPFLQAASLTGADRDSVREWDAEFKCTMGSYTDGSGNTAFGRNNMVVIIVDRA